MVAASILANASSVGANTVNSPPLSVSTRLTFGLSLPDSAEFSVVSTGLLAVAAVTNRRPSRRPTPARWAPSA